MLSFIIISVIVIVLSIQAGLTVFLKNKSARLYRIYLANAFLVAIWSAGYLVFYLAEDAKTIMTAFYLASFGWLLLPIAVNMLIVKHFKLKLVKHIGIAVKIVLFLSITALFSLLLLEENPINIHEFHELNIFQVEFKNSIFANASFIFVIALYFSALVLLLYKWKQNSSKEKSQKIILIFGVAAVISFHLIFDLLLFHQLEVVYSTFSNVSGLLWVVGSAYVVYRYSPEEAQIKASTEAVLRKMNKFLILLDKGFNISNTNNYSLRLIAHEKRDTIGVYFPDMFLEREELQACLNKVLNGSDISDAEFNIIGQNNEPLPILLYFSVLIDSFGDKLGIVVWGNDNRETVLLKEEVRQKQKVEQKMNQAKEELDKRVKDRISKLVKSHKELQVKITERMKIEQQVKAEIIEKEIIINEILNRVKVNMHVIIALLENQTGNNLSEVTNLKFKELTNRVKSILLVHDYLYMSITYSYVEFASFIKKLVYDLQKFYKKENINLNLSISDVYLDIDFAIPLGIVMNEVISNAFYHGFEDEFLKANPDKKPILTVSYRYENNRYEVIIADNGKGLPGSNVLTQENTIGLQLAKVLVNEQIGGSLSVEAIHGKTVITIIFKDKS